MLRLAKKIWDNEVRGGKRFGQWVSDVVEQAGENFQARWEARVYPLHQLIDNPFSMITGPLGAELSVAERALAIEGKVISTETSILINESKVLLEGANAAGNGAKLTNGVKSSVKKGLDNPFKNSTLKEVRNSFEKRVSQGTMERKGPNAYVNKKSGYSYNIDKGAIMAEVAKKLRSHILM